MNDRFQVRHRTGDGTVGRTATAGAHELACGATITSSTKLRADLTNCPGDGLVVVADNITLVAGDANTVKANAVDGAKGGCEGCFGYGIGVLSGTGNVVNANLVSRSAADGINAAAGTWVGLNVALRNAALGINAVGSTDGGGNRAAQNGNAEQCAGVTCRSSAPPRGGHPGDRTPPRSAHRSGDGRRGHR